MLDTLFEELMIQETVTLLFWSQLDGLQGTACSL